MLFDGGAGRTPEPTSLAERDPQHDQNHGNDTKHRQAEREEPIFRVFVVHQVSPSPSSAASPTPPITLFEAQPGIGHRLT